MVVASPAMMELLSMADRAAESPTKVLITGESGVGKDLVARHIHNQSPRKAAPFVAVNCAGLTETLLESELFGHVKGSFTGAFRDKRGKIQLAHRGTLFLDEVGEMSLRMQALLLRFLENGEIQAVGSDQPQTQVDVRVVAATNRNLNDLVAAGQFREDLYYRLRVIHLRVPAAARAARRRSGPDEALFRSRRTRADIRGRSEASVSGIPVAGQRPRTAERARTAGLAIDDGRRAGERPAGVDACHRATAGAARRSTPTGC